MSEGSDILVGWASKSITPDKPVILMGQFHPRISKYVNDPVTATALAIETSDDQAIMVSCDIVVITRKMQDGLRDRLKAKLPDFDIKKLFLSATHTHTAPNMMEDWYPPQDDDVMGATEYVNFFVDCVTDVVIEAWEGRKPGGISWAYGQAVVGHNRRAAYFDGSAQMYGNTNRDDFDSIEGYEDHSVNMLFTWDQNENPTGVVINLACPSQVTEGEYYISADFWHEVRVELNKRYSNLFVLQQCSTAGDQSPHFLFNSRAEENMRKLKGVSEREEIALRIADAVDYVFPYAKKDIRTNVPFKHIVQDLDLPVRKVTAQEYESAKLEYNRLMSKESLDENSGDYIILGRNKTTIDRYEHEKPFYQMELHVIRLGDIAIATNPFEIYLDYGIRIKARSKALQTFLVQLTCDCPGDFGAGYLPTAKAVAGGGYGAIVASNIVGPEGGQILVNKTVELINSMLS
ncbi:MAG: hypothetical protein QG641_554 [Candidatus Poribacteria bacterium]|nr:hypothetical protein [Candidatus Poribacteria bacterium]